MNGGSDTFECFDPVGTQWVAFLFLSIFRTRADGPPVQIFPGWVEGRGNKFGCISRLYGMDMGDFHLPWAGVSLGSSATPFKKSRILLHMASCSPVVI